MKLCVKANDSRTILFEKLTRRSPGIFALLYPSKILEKIRIETNPSRDDGTNPFIGAAQALSDLDFFQDCDMESPDTPEFVPPRFLNDIDAVRKRPQMYIGSVDFFGFVHYLVCPFAMLLACRPGWIAATVTESGFRIDSDAALFIEETADGEIAPFEINDHTNSLKCYEGCVLNAMSETLEVRASALGKLRELRYQRGQRISSQVLESDETSIRLSFTPDTSIFTITEISPTVLESYFRRMSFLHQGVRFRLTISEKTQEFYSSRGLGDLFDSIASPYQLLHEPVHITAEEGGLRLELIFAYQSWSDDLMWCFINNGRAVEGGTHEDGLRQAFKKLKPKLKLPLSNGVIALMSLIYPEAVWQGCIKAKIGNPELKEMIPRLVIDKAQAWFNEHPEVYQQVKQLRTFTFPDVWFG